MRLLLSIAALLSVAGPVMAQDATSIRENELWMQQQRAEQRAIAQEGQLQALDGRIRAELAIRDLKAAGSAPPTLPGPSAYTASAAAGTSPGFASIPDDRLKASNQRVDEASRNRR